MWNCRVEIRRFRNYGFFCGGNLHLSDVSRFYFSCKQNFNATCIFLIGKKSKQIRFFNEMTEIPNIIYLK